MTIARAVGTGWPEVRARFLFREVNERGYDLPLASVTKIGGVEFRSDLDISVWNPSDEPTNYKRVIPGDFVIGLRSFQSGVAYSAIEGLVSPAYTVVRARRRLVDGFYKHYFKSHRFISLLNNVSQGIRQGKTISPDDFYELRLPEPPLDKQLAVADFLDRETARLDALMAAKRRMIDLLETRFVRLAQRVLDPDESRGAGRPVPLKYRARIERGLFAHRPRNDPSLYDGDHPFIQTGDVAQADKYVDSWSQSLNDRGLLVSRKFPANTLVMVIAANIGDVAITGFPACFPDSVVAIIPDPLLLNQDYLYFSLLAAKSRLVDMAPITTQANLNVERIGTLRVLQPSLAEQELIAATLEAERQQVRTSVAVLKQSVELLYERRQALVTAAVTGEREISGVTA